MPYASALVEAATTLLWSSTGDDDRPLDRSKAVTDLSWEAACQLMAIVAATNRHCPNFVPSELEGRAVHRAVLSVFGHGTGLWDVSARLSEVDDGLLMDDAKVAKAWHAAVCSDPEVKACGLYSGASAYVGDDGLVYIG